MASSTSMENPTEEVIWKGRPTHLTAFKYYAAWTVAMIAVIAAAILLLTMQVTWWYYVLALLVIILIALGLKWLSINAVSYELSNQRLVITSGVLSRHTEEIELYRVKDWNLLQPFWLRLVKRGHVRLVTNDSSAPVLMLEGVADPLGVREKLRENVERARDRKRVRQLDVDGGGDDEFFDE